MAIKQIKIGEAYTYDRMQASQWCYDKIAEGFKARFSAKKIGNHRLYTVRWFAK